MFALKTGNQEFARDAALAFSAIVQEKGGARTYQNLVQDELRREQAKPTPAKGPLSRIAGREIAPPKRPGALER